jgi:hypothetical protein
VDGPSPCAPTHCHDIEVEAPSCLPTDSISEPVDKIIASYEQEMEAIEQQLAPVLALINGEASMQAA